MVAIIEGENAPDFSLKDTDGNVVKLSDFEGKFVVLYFYPKDNTPGCTKEACNFRDSYKIFADKGIIILGVSLDNQVSHKKFTEKYSLPFPLLCDTTGEVSRKYHVLAEKTIFGKKIWGIRRMTYIIDKEGKIKKIFAKVDVNTHDKDVLTLIVP